MLHKLIETLLEKKSKKNRNRTQCDYCEDEKTVNKYKIINDKIECSTKWTKKYTYVIDGPVRVSKNAKLEIESGVQILLLNKPENVIVEEVNVNSDFPIPPLRVVGSCLIFESGSALNAGVIRIDSCDENYSIQSINLNSGLFFCGSKTESQYNLLNISSDIIITKSNFIIEDLVMNYIGSLYFLVRDKETEIFSIKQAPNRETENIILAIPLNSVTVLGCDNDELMIKKLSINNTGANGVWSQYSSFAMDKLSIIGYQGNGLLVRDCQLEFSKRLEIVQNIVPSFPSYNGLLINISELVGNKPDILPFPPNIFNLPKDLRITTIKIYKCSKLYLISDTDIFRNEVKVIEDPPLINFNNPNGPGTYYKEVLTKDIIFVRNNI